MKDKLLLILTTAVCAILFFFVNQMTPLPGVSSGNGNPAIPLIMVLFSLFCYLIYLWIKLFHNYKINLKLVIPTMIFIGGYWFIGITQLRKSLIAYRNVKAEASVERYGGSIDWEYIDHITSFMSYHVNAQYFNLNTYFMFITLSIFIALLIVLLVKIYKILEGDMGN